MLQNRSKLCVVWEVYACSGVVAREMVTMEAGEAGVDYSGGGGGVVVGEGEAAKPRWAEEGRIGERDWLGTVEEMVARANKDP